MGPALREIARRPIQEATMSQQQIFQQITQETLEEHREIHFYLDQIARTLDSLRSGLSDVEPMRRLAAQLEGLRERLAEHHQSEEEDGLFQAIQAILPDCGVEIRRLVNQHQKLMEILEMARIHAQHGDTMEADGLRVDLQAFIEDFRQHEMEEDRLLRQAIEREANAPG